MIQEKIDQEIINYLSNTGKDFSYVLINSNLFEDFVTEMLNIFQYDIRLNYTRFKYRGKPVLRTTDIDGIIIF